MAGWQAGRLADEIQVIFEIFKIPIIDRNNRHFAYVKHYYSCASAFKLVFSAKAYCKVGF